MPKWTRVTILGIVGRAYVSTQPLDSFIDNNLVGLPPGNPNNTSQGKGKTAGAHRIVKSVNENNSSRAASAAAALVLRAGEKNLFRFPQMVGRRYFSHLEGKSKENRS
ncbi:hypothetical protein HPP92_021313 [Vanilla planifolia]|uniref:Uncharacterized protein n=1 Tax=Vanilla planifolia TaxID=51239 RepID=A0A835Q7R5_VANPL|nr:hypothetical protein HPP92_021313 [Vanilla planifolia]